MSAELKQQPLQHLQEDVRSQALERAAQPPEEEQPQAPERAPQPEAAQAEQPAGAGPLVGQDLHERIAQAMQHVLEEVRQRNTQAPQPVAQALHAEQRGDEQPQEEEQPQVQEPEGEQNMASAYVLDKEGRIIAELKQLAQQPPEEERSQAPERTEWPQAAQTEQPGGGEPLMGQALQEHIAHAMRPGLGVVLAVHLGNVQAPQLMEQGQPAGQHGAEQRQEDEQDAAPAAVLDREGRVIAALTPLQEEEQPHAQERAQEPQAE
jgi:hypothetical protein